MRDFRLVIRTKQGLHGTLTRFVCGTALRAKRGRSPLSGEQCRNQQQEECATNVGGERVHEKVGEVVLEFLREVSDMLYGQGD